VKPSGGSGLEFSNEDEPNIDRDGVKFKQEFELQTSKQPQSKPLITEISSTETE
jgi:hypothetical protein